MTDGGADAAGEDEAKSTYKGLFGAFPYAFRTSDSRLFRSYVAIGGLLAAIVTVMFVIALLVLVANTTGTAGGVFTFSRAFFIAVGMFVLAPLIAPVLYVARRHRRRTPISEHYDTAMALAGYAFILALYVGLVASIPECFDFGDGTTCRDPPQGLFAPAVAVLYALPPVSGLVPPAVTGVAIVLVDRYLR
ncbi:hypothetical protein [Halorientalis litorea]|jgi:hypothetical protein|uniref:hypothetical protein n=1 Tax=Halorientalis litorea TaxID=2931977 RepID=UPI001FF3D87E|nr:hypothetical protein [Halorientalis litorea]